VRFPTYLYLLLNNGVVSHCDHQPKQVTLFQAGEHKSVPIKVRQSCYKRGSLVAVVEGMVVAQPVQQGGRVHDGLVVLHRIAKTGLLATHGRRKKAHAAHTRWINGVRSISEIGAQPLVNENHVFDRKQPEEVRRSPLGLDRRHIGRPGPNNRSPAQELTNHGTRDFARTAVDVFVRVINRDAPLDESESHGIWIDTCALGETRNGNGSRHATESSWNSGRRTGCFHLVRVPIYQSDHRVNLRMAE
jgi:hypothetical protein